MDKKTGNMRNGVVLNFSEPIDARLPSNRWRIYVFKDSASSTGGTSSKDKDKDKREEDKRDKDASLLDTIAVHRKSCYLFGRDDRVSDISVLHPSCSKQHAVLQFRSINSSDSSLTNTITVKPYLMDLDSSNGTFLNGSPIEGARYYELLSGDCVKFGSSTRDYVFLKEDDAAAN